MNLYFFDTSAVVKRYIQETGTAWVQSLTSANPNNYLYLANITAVEFTSAVVRRQKGGTISSSEATTALSQFRQEFNNKYHIIEVIPPLVDRADRLAETYALRAYDAVQLSALLEVDQFRSKHAVSALTVISADAELNAAASAEGLTVENPHAHP